jgi:DNA polymerase elongation subunit (family B)
MKSFINIYEPMKEGKYKKNNGSFVVRTKAGSKTYTIPWYFVLKLSEIKTRAQYNDVIKLKKQQYVDKFEKDGEWLKVYMPYGKRREIIRYLEDSVKVPTYEGDLTMWQRWLTDSDIELEEDQKILYFDIETDDLKPGIIPGNEIITCIGAIGSDGKRYQFFSTTDERKILMDFKRVLNRYDILTGWNSETFDLVAIAERCRIHGIPFGCKVSTWAKAGKGGLTGVRVAGKMRARPVEFNHIDMMMKVKEMHYRDTELIKRVRSFSLAAVAKEFLPEKFWKIDTGEISMYDLSRKYPEKMKKYNMRDIEILVELDKKLSIIKQKIIEQHVCNARINDYTSHGKIDPFALRWARKLGKHLPTRPGFGLKWKEGDDYGNQELTAEDKEIEGNTLGYHGEESVTKGDYIGGFVFEPVKGMHRNIYVFDFQSLYPSIIKTFNVSIDSYLGTVKQIGEHKGIALPIRDESKRAIFSSEEKGIIPTIIQSVLDQRNHIRFEIMPKVKKDSAEYWNWHYRQYAFKVLANSMYGVMGAAFSRYFKKEIAEGITLTGQTVIKTMANWMEKQGFKVIYGDSDSLFVKINREVNMENMQKVMKIYLDNFLKPCGIKESAMQMDFEKKFERFVMVAKKKYVGIAKDGSRKTSGLELKKRDTLPKAEEWQKWLIDTLLTKETLDMGFFLKEVLKWRETVYNGKLKKEEILFQKRLSQEIDEYGTKLVQDHKTGKPKRGKDGQERTVPIPVHAKVALALKERFKGAKGKEHLWEASSYVPYIITNSDKNLEAIWAEDFDGHYDKDYYWEMCYGPSQRVLEAVFPQKIWERLARRKSKINPKQLLLKFK